MQKGFRHIAIVLIGSVGIAAPTVASIASAHPSGHSECLPRRAHVIAEDRDVRVYSIAAMKMAGSREVTYACLLRSGIAMKLTEPHHHRPASSKFVALDDAMVAYTYSGIGVDTGTTEIIAANVATRQLLLTVPEAGGYTDGCAISFRDLEGLVVTDHGSVAWIVRAGHGCRTQTYQVYDKSRLSDPAILDEGLGIDPESLRVSKRSVSWEDGGQRRHALLP